MIKSKKLQGVTLIELLIAISLLTLIIFAGTAIYLSGWNMFRDAQSRAQAARNATIPMMHIKKNLQQAINFIRTSDTELRFRTYTNITNQTTVTRSYSFTNNTIEYDDNIAVAGGAITVGRYIQNFTFTISQDSATNGTTAVITITSTDNNNANQYSITTTTEARYGSIPPVTL